MKKKIILMIISSIILTFIIYQTSKTEKVYLLSLGDGLASGMTSYQVEGYNYNDYLRDDLESKQKLKKYVHEFSRSELSVENLITCIENNYTLKEINLSIQQALSKSDIITVAIGMDELASISIKQKILNREKEDFKKDMDKLLNLIRNFNDKKIILLGLYKAYNMEEDTINELNEILKKLAQDYQMDFVNIEDVVNNPDYFLMDTSYYLNYKGHQEIYHRILKKID